MIITIDGPSGSGKSTIAKKIAKKLSFSYFDTGAMYRALTFLILKNKIDLNDDNSIEQLLPEFDYKIEIDEQNNKKYFLNNEEITTQIRDIGITKAVSSVSEKYFVRKYLVNIQKSYSLNKNAVFEGRDMGTVVFPNADFKFFLTASDKIRAKRRFLELIEKFPDKSFDEDQILQDINKRDEIDSTRKISPLKCAPDAMVIDTSNLLIEQVEENILNIIQKAIP
jgi:CMP/dCMP kinase